MGVGGWAGGWAMLAVLEGGGWREVAQYSEVGLVVLWPSNQRLVGSHASASWSRTC